MRNPKEWDWQIIGLTLFGFAAVGLFVFMIFAATQPEEHPNACWIEDKKNLPSEQICGDVSKAPVGAHGFTDNTLPVEAR